LHHKYGTDEFYLSPLGLWSWRTSSMPYWTITCCWEHL